MSTQLTQTTFKAIEEKFISLTDKDTFIKEASFALQAANKNKQLLNCDQQTVVQALMNVANIGLTLNPVSKLAYLVPRYNSVTRKVECCLEPSYQGLVKLITDTGGVTQVYCYPVYDGDEFDETLGSEPKIIHRPKRKTTNITHVYAIAVFPDGKQQFEIMTKEDVEDIRSVSSSYKAFKEGKIKSCVWVDHESEMYRKTVVRRLCKYLPKTDKWERVSQAINLDEQDYAITMYQESTMETLLINANISPEESQELYRELPTMSRNRAEKMISYLRQNQVEPMQAHGNPSVTDAANELGKVMNNPDK